MLKMGFGECYLDPIRKPDSTIDLRPLGEEAPTEWLIWELSNPRNPPRISWTRRRSCQAPKRLPPQVLRVRVCVATPSVNPPPHSCLGKSQPVYRLALQGLQNALHKELTVRGDFLQALDRGQGQKGDDWNAKGGIARMKKLMLHNFTITGALFFWCASDEISIMFI